MKNKSIFWLLIAVLIMVPALAACGNNTELGDGIYVMPHGTGLGFDNCLVCHTGGLYAMPDDAIHNVGIETCILCHPESTTTVTTTTPTPTTTTTPTITTPTITTPTTTTTPPQGPISYESHYLYTDVSLCNLCHTGLAPILANPENHADYANDSCFDAGCHELPVKE